jgi:predicted transposase/invertase (TIGR01784 family)
MAMEKDKISRRAFVNPETGYLSQLLDMDVVALQQVPPRLRQTIQERETDIVLLVHLRGGKRIILHIEFQSNNDHKMVRRMAIYDYMLYDEQLLPVISYVIYIILAVNLCVWKIKLSLGITIILVA